MKKHDWKKWSLSTNGIKGILIRRYRTENGRRIWETYPTANYKHLSQDEIEALLRRLNVRHINAQNEALERYNFDHAFINPNVLKAFERYLETKANNAEYIRRLLSMLNEYPFHFFIHKLKVTDPNLWKKKEELFGHFLLEKDLSSEHIQRIIQHTNRFISFLHDKYPDEIRLTKLNSISNTVLKKRKGLQQVQRQKYISIEDFNKICSEVDQRILAPIKLAYYFGLRRSEALGLTINDVFEDSLSVERQLIKVEPRVEYDLLKTFETRHVPYWNTTPEEAYELVSKMKLLHPDTLGHIFKKEMKRLKMPFLFHDFRRTFITNALRKYHYRDVQLAAGHSQIKTTELYAQDDRKLQKKRFIPS